jgi:hypothetical protein
VKKQGVATVNLQRPGVKPISSLTTVFAGEQRDRPGLEKRIEAELKQRSALGFEFLSIGFMRHACSYALPLRTIQLI